MEQIDIYDSFKTRLGTGICEVFCLPGKVDWNAIEALAEQQGLYAFVIDG